MKVMLVYANDRMDNLISIAPSILSAYVKSGGHDVRLYDTTFIDEGKEIGDEFRIKTLQLKPARLADQGITRKKMTTKELQTDFRRTVLNNQPGIIGFSALEITYDQTARLIDAIKDLSIPIIVGGMYPTFAPRMVLENPSIDMICEGEGELAFQELVNKLADIENISNLFQMRSSAETGMVERRFCPPENIIQTANISMRVAGDIFYRGGLKAQLNEFGNGDYMESKKVGLQRPDIDMKQLLPPDYSIYESQRFKKPMGGYIWNAIAVETARGCPYECTFCCVPQQQAHHEAAIAFRKEIRQKGGLAASILQRVDGPEVGHHKQKSPQKFIREVQRAVEDFGVNYLYIGDETFLAKSRSWLQEFFRVYEEFKLPPGSLPEGFVETNPRFRRQDGTERLPFFTSTRVETVASPRNREYAKAMEYVGCHNIALGIESGDPAYRAKFLQRLMPDETILAGFKAFEETSIRISANNIIGMPHETREDILNTIRINRLVNPDSIIINAFRPYTGTPLREECIRLGLITPGIRAEDNRALEQFYNGVLSAEEIEGLRKTFVLYVTFPEERWPEIKRAEKDDVLFEKLSQEFHEGNFLERKCRVNRYERSEHSLQDLASQGVEITDPC